MYSRRVCSLKGKTHLAEMRGVGSSPAKPMFL